MILEHEINTEMHNRRLEAINRLSKIVHPRYVDQFAKILYYSWQENLAEAETIADAVDFYPIDFCAIAENVNEFKDLLLIERESSYMEGYA